MNSTAVAVFLGVNTDHSFSDSMRSAIAYIDETDDKSSALKYWAWIGMCDSSNQAWTDSLDREGNSNWTGEQILENFIGHLECVTDIYFNHSNKNP